MEKIPPIVRPYNSDIGLTGESAYHWALFLANEADMRNDIVAYDKWKSAADSLRPVPGKAIPASVHYPALEDEIKKYEARTITVTSK